MTRRPTMAFRWALPILLGPLGLVYFAGAAPDPKRPNIVFLLADDLGYGDLGCYGRKDIRTPALDHLAAEGVRFTQHYANGPECSPTRTALLTGRYQQRVGGLECAIGSGNVGRYDDAIRLRESNDLGLPVEQSTVLRVLKEQGYRTGLSGKWHLGYEERFSPNRHGFDHAFYALGGELDYFHHTEPNGSHVLRLNGKPLHRQGYFTDLVTEDAVTFIQKRDSSPFFLYVAYTAPHAPYQGPDDIEPDPLPATDVRWNQSQAPPATYVAMIERMDEGIGTILRMLEREDLASNTLVLFASDNGGTRSARNEPLRGRKGQTFEGGIRVPAIARWPGVLPLAITSDQVCITMDFSCSMVRAAGGLGLAERLDGIDVLGLVASGGPPVPRTLFWRKRRGEETWWGVRDGNWKYVKRANPSRSEEHLFRLDTDPAEASDLVGREASGLGRLQEVLAAWETAVRPRR